LESGELQKRCKSREEFKFMLEKEMERLLEETEREFN